MFSNGDILSVNIEYINHSLRKILNKSTLDALGYISNEEIVVINQGKVSDDLWFLQTLPRNTQNQTYHNGNGVTLFFPKVEYLERSFINLNKLKQSEPKTLYAINNEVKTSIPAFYLVKITGFSRIINAYVIELPRELNENEILAITEERILPGLFGKITQI